MLDGNPSPASNAETYYNNLLGVYEDDDTIEQYKSVFSYFDTDKFLRYNEDLDTDEIGNLYEDNYDVTAQKEATFYLYAGAENENQNFLVNYATQDQVVTASASDKDDTTTDNPDETAPTTQGTNPLLLISSIIIAVALVLAIASIIFRKIWKKARKNILSKKRKPKKEKSKRVKIAKVETEEPKEEIDEIALTTINPLD